MRVSPAEPGVYLLLINKALHFVDKFKDSMISNGQPNINTLQVMRQLHYVSGKRVDLIDASQKEFNDSTFVSTLERLKKRSVSTRAYIDIHLSKSSWKTEDFKNEMALFSIAAQQLEGLHDIAYHDLLSLTEQTQKYSTLSLFGLVFAATVITLLLMRISLSRIKEALHEIRRINNELEQRIELRTKDLNHSNMQLHTSLTQLKLAQEQMIQSKKMASLGGLVAGVAHEINTPVGVSLSAVSYMSGIVEKYSGIYAKGELTEEDFDNLLQVTNDSSKIIHVNLEKATELIKSFKNVSVDQSHDHRRCINLKSYLEEIYSSLKPKFKTNQHKLHINCANTIELHINPGSLSQVINNLVINSLTHGFDKTHKGDITIDICVLNEQIEMTYRDNGIGITKEVAKQIFEPFYTTKRHLGGSGLGMHIVYNLVTQSLKGDIELRQYDQQEGACFIIYLPIPDK